VPASTAPVADERLPSEEFPISSTPLGKINELAGALSDVWVPRGLLRQQPDDAPARVGYLRNVLLLDSTPTDVRDEVWRFIGGMARQRRDDWNLFALGVAYPGLRKRARRLAPPPTPFEVVEAVHFDLAAEFLLAVHRLPLHRPNVISRFLGAAYDQASGRKKPPQPRMVNIDVVDPVEIEEALARNQAAPHTSAEEPHDVLHRLVAATDATADGLRLTEQHAVLIQRTYLDGQPLTAVAADLGMSVPTASKRRSRAARLIAALLGRPQLAETTDDG